MAVHRPCTQCGDVKECRMHKTDRCSAPVEIKPGGVRKGSKKNPGTVHCAQAFVTLSGGVQGCPVHGIRAAIIEYLCTGCRRDLEVA